MIPVPNVHWPVSLSERGPESDPGILLVGEAVLAGIKFKVTALRVSEYGRGPDFRADIADEEYEVSLQNMTESLEDLVESIEPASIEMNGGRYVVWMVPYPAR